MTRFSFRLRRLLLVACLGVAGLTTGCTKHSDPRTEGGALSATPHPLSGSELARPPAPPLRGGIAWLNTARPLELSELRGQVVLLDFFTYCCINCMHVLPVLGKLERAYAKKPVVIIGVHSGKFDAEKDVGNIRAALERYRVEHPVVVDSNFAIWKAYGVDSWPTLVVIDTHGRIAGSLSGEPTEKQLSSVIDAALARGARDGSLAKAPLHLSRPPTAPKGPLAFPGKVAVAPDGRIAIADSDHERIVIVDKNGKELDVAGSGIVGRADGSFEAASFHRPQGLAWSPDDRRLYVADTENHEIRELDLRARRVTTIAGTGKKGTKEDGGPALSVALRSPWALALDGQELFVAMAGAHQIWTLDLARHVIEPFAGTGEEGIADGPLASAEFAQPSGLALAGHTLYVADSEDSGVRAIDLDKGVVHTLVGSGLFHFGDRDGRGEAALLQHPLGVAAAPGALYVADTYNNKIKRIDLHTLEVTSLAGGSSATLFEPGGVALLPDGRLLIADTNNHRLRTLDAKTDALADFDLSGVAPPAVTGLVAGDDAQPSGPSGPVARQRIRANGQLGPGRGTVVIQLKAPPGGKLTVGGPLVVKAHGQDLKFPKQISETLKPKELPVRLPIVVADGARSPAKIDLTYYWCSTGQNGSCNPVRAHLLVKLDLSGTGPGGEAYFTYAPRVKAR
jgi:DNA-binding beta-propeller fold protein YncE